MEELEVYLNDELVKVKIIYKNNKNIYFRFDSEGNLIITVHPRISKKKIIKLVKENEKSLIRLMKRNKKKQDQAGEIRLLGLKY